MLRVRLEGASTFFPGLLFAEVVDALCGVLNLPFPGPHNNWRSPDGVNGNGFVGTPAASQAKASERGASKQVSKSNGLREEHSHRGNGYISITGKRMVASGVGMDCEGDRCMLVWIRGVGGVEVWVMSGW